MVGQKRRGLRWVRESISEDIGGIISLYNRWDEIIQNVAAFSISRTRKMICYPDLVLFSYPDVYLFDRY